MRVSARDIPHTRTVAEGMYVATYVHTYVRILLLQVLKVMLMPSADYHFNRSLQCASKIASASDLRGCGP